MLSLELENFFKAKFHSFVGKRLQYLVPFIEFVFFVNYSLDCFSICIVYVTIKFIIEDEYCHVNYIHLSDKGIMFLTVAFR